MTKGFSFSALFIIILLFSSCPMEAESDLEDSDTKITWVTTKPTLNGNTYEIRLPTELAWLATQSEDENFVGKTIKFMNTIDMKNQGFNGIPRFAGIMDGQGYSITNLTIDRSDDIYVGLVKYLEGGTIKNLTIESGTIKGRHHVGAFVGVARSGNSPGTASPKLSGLTNKAAVTGIAIVGGIIGAAPNGGTPNSIIENVQNWGNIKGWDTSIGGIVGQLSYASVTNATNYGKVDGEGKVGGIIGWADAVNIQTACNMGNVTVKKGIGYSVGGIIGTADGTSCAIEINNATNSGVVKITGQIQIYFDEFKNVYVYFITAGGIIGEAIEGMTITNATNTASVFATAGAAIAGGIIGHSLVTTSAVLIEGVENTGNVGVSGFTTTIGGTNYFCTSGGIIGIADVSSPDLLEIQNTTNTGTISAIGNSAIKGDIVGQGIDKVTITHAR